MGPIERSQYEAAKERRARLFMAAPPIPVAAAFAAPALRAEPKQSPTSIHFQWAGKPIYVGGISKTSWSCCLSYQPLSHEPLSVQRIISMVAKEFGVSVVDIMSGRREMATVHARHVGMYLTKKLTMRSFPDIGRRFGGRDHTTVLNAVSRIEDLLLDDPDLVARVARLEARVSAQ